jgi:hypothetical protein
MTKAETAQMLESAGYDLFDEMTIKKLNARRQQERTDRL